MSRESGHKRTTDRRKIIGWYRENIKDYQEKIAKYKRLIETVNSRIEALEKLIEKEEQYDIAGGLLNES